MQLVGLNHDEEKEVYYQTYILIFELFKSEFASKIEEGTKKFVKGLNLKSEEKSKITVSQEEYSNVKNFFLGSINHKDYEFARMFVQSQIFANYINDFLDSIKTN